MSTPIRRTITIDKVGKINAIITHKTYYDNGVSTVNWLVKLGAEIDIDNIPLTEDDHGE